MKVGGQILWNVTPICRPAPSTDPDGRRTVQRYLGCRLPAPTQRGRCGDDQRASGIEHQAHDTHQLGIGGFQFGSPRDWNLVCSVLTPAKQRSPSGCAPA